MIWQDGSKVLLEKALETIRRLWGRVYTSPIVQAGNGRLLGSGGMGMVFPRDKEMLENPRLWDPPGAMLNLE